MIKPITAQLQHWRKHICKPDGTFVVWGFVYDDIHMRFPDGHWIHTSSVKEIVDDIAITDSGSNYLLVGPASGDPITLEMRCRKQEQRLLE